MALQNAKPLKYEDFVPASTATEDDGTRSDRVRARLEGWDSDGLVWRRLKVGADGTLASSGGGGGGGPVTIADGADTAQGTTTDVAWVSGAGSLIAISKAEFAKLEAIRALLAGSITVTGTFYQATQPVSGPLTDAQLRASAVPVSIASMPSTPVTGPLTDAQLRNTAVSVSHGGLTDAQLRATAVPVSHGGLTDTQLRASAVPVSGTVSTGGLTDTQLRASAVPVSGPLTDTQLRASAVPVSGPLTDTQLRASAVPVSGTVTAQDGGGSITVDAPVATPVWVRLSDGAAAFVGQKAMAASIPVVLASDQSSLPTTEARLPAALVGGRLDENIGAVGGTAMVAIDGAIGASVPILAGGRAFAPPSFPAAVSADGDIQTPWMDRYGAQVIRPRQLASYSAMYRAALAAATSTLTFTFVANTDKQLATIYHANTATKLVRVRRIWIELVKTGAVAGEVQFELRQLSATTAPATGNPVITPSKRSADSGAAESTCLALPTTAGSEVAVNSPIASKIFNLAASLGTASGTGVLPLDAGRITLYDDAISDDEEMAPSMRVGIAEGFAVVGRSTAAVPIFFIIKMDFTEEV